MVFQGLRFVGRSDDLGSAAVPISGSGDRMRRVLDRHPSGRFGQVRRAQPEAARPFLFDDGRGPGRPFRRPLS